MANKRLHHLSHDTPLAPLDLWVVPPTQTSVEKDTEFELRPLTAIKNQTQVEFEIQLAENEYLNLAESYLYVKAQVILNKAGDAAATKEDWDNVVPEDYFLHTIWSQVEIAIGGKELTLSPSTYNYRAYLDCLLGMTQDAKDSFLTASMWLNKRDKNNAIRPAVDTSAKGKIFEMMGRLHIDLVFQERLILGGSNIKIKLNPASPKLYFRAGEGVEPTLDLLDVAIHAHVSKVTPELMKFHKESLRISPCKYQFTRVEVRRLGVPKDTVDACFDNVLRGQIPRRMFVGFVDSDAFTGSYTKNPYSFHHNHVTFAAAYVDGNQYPTKAYTPDFTNGLYCREFLSLYQSLNQNYSDTYMKINYTDYANKHSLFAFNFSPDLTSGPGSDGHLSQVQFGTLRLHFRFKDALQTPLNALIYCEFDSLVELNEDRTVSTSYN